MYVNEDVFSVSIFDDFIVKQLIECVLNNFFILTVLAYY